MKSPATKCKLCNRIVTVADADGHLQHVHNINMGLPKLEITEPIRAPKICNKSIGAFFRAPDVRRIIATAPSMLRAFDEISTHVGRNAGTLSRYWYRWIVTDEGKAFQEELAEERASLFGAEAVAA